MYLDYISLFWVIMGVLLAGIFLGKIWSYLSAKEEQIRERRLLRGSSSYVLGMNYLISNQPELAIMELSRAAKQDPEAVEVQIVLGNLYREKGQVDRAIQVHKGALQRRGISPVEENLALFCLGLDYKSAGFVDRSIEIFEQLIDKDRGDERPFELLIKLYQEVDQYDKSYRLQQELMRLRRSDDSSVLAFLEVQMGKKLMDRGEREAAERRFQRAIDIEPRTYPAYLYFGDLLHQRGEKQRAAEMWERMVRVRYKRGHLAFSRLADVYNELGDGAKLEAILKEVIDNHPYDWRSRVFLAETYAEKGRIEDAFALFKEALQFNPHSLAIHQKIWKLFSHGKFDKELVSEYLELAGEIIFFLDPFVCIECGYRTTEFLWKCPHCHSWDSFTEAKM